MVDGDFIAIDGDDFSFKKQITLSGFPSGGGHPLHQNDLLPVT